MCWRVPNGFQAAFAVDDGAVWFSVFRLPLPMRLRQPENGLSRSQLIAQINPACSFQSNVP
ncbi:MAG: hypothetical protein ACFNNL_01710 [Kingella oralis]